MYKTGICRVNINVVKKHVLLGDHSLAGVPDCFDRNKISSGGDLSHYSSASLY